MDQQNVVSLYDGILVSLKKEVLSRATTARMNLEDTVLREIRQSQKGTYYRIPLI